MSSYFSTFRQTGTDRLERFGKDLLAALLYPFQSILRAILALVLAGLVFVVLILASQPTGVLDMLLRHPDIAITTPYIENMFMLNLSVVSHKGWLPIALSVTYAVLTGIALTNMVAQIRMLQVGSLANVGGILPGLFAAGCASCGPGLLALIGFTGGFAGILSQHPTVLRLGGMGLFLFFLGLSGDPRECRID
jgi:hypothetical protein